jgi:rubrerythrin
MRRRPLFIVLVCLASAVVGCGPSGHGAETDPEKASDAEILNAALARELTALDLYVRFAPRLGAPDRALLARLRSHEQEYIDAITKAIRGLGGDVEAEPEPLEMSKSADRAEILERGLELESNSLGAYLEAAPRLYASAPRTLATALAAGHSQHLVLLRQARGAELLGSIPEGFDSGVGD